MIEKNTLWMKNKIIFLFIADFIREYGSSERNF
jgi:hypothetical protein